VLAARFKLLKVEGRVDALFNDARDLLKLRRHARDAAPLRCWSPSHTEKKLHVLQYENQNLAPLSFGDHVRAQTRRHGAHNRTVRLCSEKGASFPRNSRGPKAFELVHAVAKRWYALYQSVKHLLGRATEMRHAAFYIRPARALDGNDAIGHHVLFPAQLDGVEQVKHEGHQRLAAEPRDAAPPRKPLQLLLRDPRF
jgi:hypothetical protein